MHGENVKTIPRNVPNQEVILQPSCRKKQKTFWLKIVSFKYMFSCINVEISVAKFVLNINRELVRNDREITDLSHVEKCALVRKISHFSWSRKWQMSSENPQLLNTAESIFTNWWSRKRGNMVNRKINSICTQNNQIHAVSVSFKNMTLF